MGYSIILFEYLPRDTNRNGERRDAGPISFYKPDVNEIRKKYISLNEHMADVVCTVKCNAILITGIFSRECTPRLAQRLLRIAWRRSTPGNEIPPNFRCYENEDAIMRIVETSIGLHSVVIGDTQVYSQIISPFVNTPVAETKKFLANIAKICEKTRAQAEKNTDLYKGGCSVERIGMDFLASYLNESGRSRIGVLGTGQSANLVSKIAKEQQMEVFVYGRNKEGLKEIISKYQAAEWSVRDDEIDAVVVCLPNDDDARKFVENTVQSIKWSPGNRIVLDISPEPFNIGHLIGDCRIIDWPIIQERANAVSKARANEKSKVLNICKTVRIEMDHLLRSAPTEKRKGTDVSVSKENKRPVLEALSDGLANLHSASKEQGLIQIITPGDIGITAEIAKNFKRRICLTKIDPGVASGIFEIGAYKSDVHNAANGLCDEVIEYHSEFYTNSLQSLIDSAIKAISSFTQSFYKERPLIPTVVSYTEIARLLYNSGLNHAFGDEFSPYHKKVIGDFYQNNYQSDIVVITHHPSSSKNVFNHTSDDWVSDSFEILFNGWDVVQGGIREVDRQSLTLTMEDLDMKADDLCLEYIKRSCEIPEHGGFWLNVSRILASCLGEINVDIVWG